ncbi:hypothetical protein [Actinoplanes sp. NPDC051859]|uniref:hypothetical protein n=1 Tax=Actinoplanes sp. NPDC051859 TaxID=3363909 RepID=UPI0037B3EFE3
MSDLSPTVTSGTGEWFDAAQPARSVSAASVLDRSRNPHTGPSAPDLDQHIGDLIDGPGREIRPHRALKHPTGATTTITGPGGPPRRSRAVMIAGTALTAAVLVGGTVAGVTYFADGGKDTTSVLELGVVGKNSPRTVSALTEGRTQATFELTSAATRVTVRSEDLGDNLYRMTTADDSGVLPRAAVERDTVRLALEPDSDGGARAVEIVLSAKVTWTLRFADVVDEQNVDLTGGRIAGIDVAGGARRAEIQLPAATGTVPVKFAGEVDELAMSAPAGNPVRVQVKGGVGTVSAGAKTLRDVPPGSTLTPKDWSRGNRYDVEAASRVTLLSINSAP